MAISIRDPRILKAIEEDLQMGFDQKTVRATLVNGEGAPPHTSLFIKKRKMHPIDADGYMRLASVKRIEERRLAAHEVSGGLLEQEGIRFKKERKKGSILEQLFELMRPQRRQT